MKSNENGNQSDHTSQIRSTCISVPLQNGPVTALLPAPYPAPPYPVVQVFTESFVCGTVVF